MFSSPNIRALPTASRITGKDSKKSYRQKGEDWNAIEERRIGDSRKHVSEFYGKFDVKVVKRSDYR